MATVHERSRGRVPLVPQLACRQRVLCLAPPDNAVKIFRVTSLLSIPRRSREAGRGGSARAPNAVAACRAVAAIWRRIVRASCPDSPWKRLTSPYMRESGFGVLGTPESEMRISESLRAVEGHSTSKGRWVVLAFVRHYSVIPPRPP